MVSQKDTHREAKRIGSIALGKKRTGKLKPCKLFGAKQSPKKKIKIPFSPRPLEKGFPNDNTGETRLGHALKHGWIGRDFNRAITPEPSCPTF
jgi:hypothetical protein